MHDPKGKTRIALKDVVGAADISVCGRWRRTLSRDWSNGEPVRAILWIGMNPSTADASADDPTCLRETNFSRAWGFNRYLKCNVMDWRATFPTDLPNDPDMASTPENTRAILQAAQSASLIVAAWGKVPRVHEPIATRIHQALLAQNYTLHCLGQNQDGSPKHPLYLRKDSALRPFPTP